MRKRSGSCQKKQVPGSCKNELRRYTMDRHEHIWNKEQRYVNIGYMFFGGEDPGRKIEPPRRSHEVIRVISRRHGVSKLPYIKQVNFPHGIF